MKSDDELKRDVDNELHWNPELNATDIATIAISGAVTLSRSRPITSTRSIWRR